MSNATPTHTTDCGSAWCPGCNNYELGRYLSSNHEQYTCFYAPSDEAAVAKARSFVESDRMHPFAINVEQVLFRGGDIIATFPAP